MKTWNFYSWKASKWENLKFTNNFLFPEPKCCQNQYFMDISTLRENSFTMEFGTSSISARNAKTETEVERHAEKKQPQLEKQRCKCSVRVPRAPAVPCASPVPAPGTAAWPGHRCPVLSPAGAALESLGIHLCSATPAWPGLLALMLLLWPSIVQQKGFSCSSMPVRAH